jgi:spermidine synthase
MSRSPAPPIRRARLSILLCSVFLLSGAAALVFEALWFYQAGIALGNSVWASSLVLAGFMGGLALGNAMAARWGDEFSNPVRSYAVLEVVIAISGVALVHLLPLLTPLLAPILGALEATGWLLNSARFAISFALLLIPSTAMGMTLPLLTKALTRFDRSFGRALGRLYAWNTAGAVAGVIVAETVLVPGIGIRRAALAAGLLNLAAAAVALWLSTRFEDAKDPGTSATRGRWNPGRGGSWLASAFLTGLVLLALEVVWFRLLSLYSHNTSSVFAFMLAIVLAGIALGGAIAGALLRKWPGAHRFAPAVAFAAGGLCAATYRVLPLAASAAGIQLATSWRELLSIGMPLMFPVSCLSGVFFTLVGAGLREDLSSETSTTGALTLANTLGAALGALLGGFVLLPVLGIEKSLFALCLGYGFVGCILLLRTTMSIRGRALWSGAFILFAALFPFGAMQRQHIPHALALWGSPPLDTVTVREGTAETILYIDMKWLGETVSHRMMTNSFSMSGTGMVARRYMKLYVYWPAAVHPELKSALLISYGVGMTAKALTDTGSLESIDVVDISRDILEMNEIVYPNPADHPLNDPRVEVHIEDGRYFLATTDRRYDLITGEPPPPEMAGVASLYTREYFELVHDRLEEGGIATYWLPMHRRSDASALSIIGAFCGAFEDCSLWNGMGSDLMLVGTRNLQSAASRAHFERQWSDQKVATELIGLGFERPEQLGALFIGDADYLWNLVGDEPPLVDDFPKRIAAPTASAKRRRALFAALRDTDAARERFRTSPLIERLWPDALRRESLPYFRFQRLINARGWHDGPRLPQLFEEVRMVLQDSPLQVLAAWPLWSHLDLERIAQDLTEQGSDLAEAHYHLGIGSLARRDYDGAAAHLARAQSLQNPYEIAAVTRIFALCMAGRLEDAAALAREQHDRLGKDEEVLEFWSWLDATFGIDASGPAG